MADDRDPRPPGRRRLASRWALPVVVAGLNGVAVMGVAHVTASTVNPLRSTRSVPALGQVLGERLALGCAPDRSDPAIELLAASTTITASAIAATSACDGP